MGTITNVRVRVGTKQADVSEGLEQSLAQSKFPKSNENKSCYSILRTLGVDGKSISILERKKLGSEMKQGTSPRSHTEKVSGHVNPPRFLLHQPPLPPPHNTHILPSPFHPVLCPSTFLYPGHFLPFIIWLVSACHCPQKLADASPPASASIRGLAMYTPL